MPKSEAVEKSTDAVDADAATIEIQDYRRLVSELATAASGEVLFNRNLEHAAVIVEYIFRKSQNEVDIVSHRLIDKIFGTPKLIEAAMTFLTQNEHPKLNIISVERGFFDAPAPERAKRTKN